MSKMPTKEEALNFIRQKLTAFYSILFPLLVQCVVLVDVLSITDVSGVNLGGK